MGSMSLIHWVIVLVVVLLLFGPSRLPNLAKSIGESIREFKKGINPADQKPQITEEQKKVSDDSQKPS
jgi:sec-independent protein translocase protein TatA